MNKSFAIGIGATLILSSLTALAAGSDIGRMRLENIPLGTELLLKEPVHLSAQSPFLTLRSDTGVSCEMIAPKMMGDLELTGTLRVIDTDVMAHANPRTFQWDFHVTTLHLVSGQGVRLRMNCTYAFGSGPELHEPVRIKEFEEAARGLFRVKMPDSL